MHAIVRQRRDIALITVIHDHHPRSGSHEVVAVGYGRELVLLAVGRDHRGAAEEQILPFLESVVILA